MKTVCGKSSLTFAVIVLIVLLASGCAAIRAYFHWCGRTEILPDGRRFPKSPKFSLIPESLEASSPLRTDGVYIKWSTKRSRRSLLWCRYIRFWPDGRVCSGASPMFPPSARRADSFLDVSVGFYRCNGTDLWIELFDPLSYIGIHGRIVGDTIVFDTTTLRTIYKYDSVREPIVTTNPDGTYDPFTYSFLPLKGMTRMPDWSPTGMLHNAVSPQGAR